MWYPAGRVHEDEYAIYDVLHACESAAHIKAPLYYYRKTPGSITSASNPRELLDEARALSHRVHSAARNGDRTVAAQALKKMAMDCAFRYRSYDEAMRRDERTEEAFLVVRRDLRAYGNCLPGAERVRLGVILAHPEAVKMLVRKR